MSVFSKKFKDLLLPEKNKKLGDKIHEFKLIPGDLFMFLLILLILIGTFPRLPPKVNLYDDSSAFKKDTWSVVIKIIRISFTRLDRTMLEKNLYGNIYLFLYKLIK